MNVSDHYQQCLKYELILERIREHYPDGASSYQLAPVDQLHIGGILASERLLQATALLPPDAAVLEIGSGLGGLARLARKQHELRFTSLDICHSLNQIHHEINQHQALPDQAVISADAMALPFAAESFDMVVLQHSLLNIPDSDKALAECHRVLKSKGVLLLHEVVSGPESDAMRYPVPWASQATLSHLLPVEALVEKVSNYFDQAECCDWSAEAIEWRKRQLQKERAQLNTAGSKQPSAPLSPALVLGDDFPTMGKNVAHNLEAGAIRVVELKARKRPVT